MTNDQIFEFFRRLAEDNPEPETELEYGNAYQLVVAVALSAQATDVGVNKATRALFQKVKTPQQMLDLGLDGLIEHIKTIGLYRNKAKNVIKMAQILVEKYDGVVPASRAANHFSAQARESAHFSLALAVVKTATAISAKVSGICKSLMGR